MTPESTRRAWVLAGIFGWITAGLLIVSFCLDLVNLDALSAIIEGSAIVTIAGGWYVINQLVDHTAGLKRALRLLAFTDPTWFVPHQDRPHADVS